VFHGERISRRRKAAFSALIAIVYIFSYINLQVKDNVSNVLQLCIKDHLICCVGVSLSDIN
jgi:hypothetical protein